MQVTFDELVAHGIEVGANMVGGMPWSFEYRGHAVSHENDECYLVDVPGGTLRITPDDVIIVDSKGNLFKGKLIRRNS